MAVSGDCSASTQVLPYQGAVHMPAAMLQVESARGPSEPFLGLHGGNYTRGQCKAHAACRAHHKDRADLHVTAQQVAAEIEEGGGLTAVCRQ